MLAVSHLKKSFGGVRAVDDCSFNVPPRRITALIGPNGAGKTTVFNCCSGLVKPDAGEVARHGRRLNPLPVHQRAQGGIARTFQAVRLFGNLNVLENCLLALEPQDQRLGHSFGVRRREGGRLHRHEQVREVLHLVGLTQPLETLAADLSYGQGKLLELTRALLLPHQVLLLDEPVAGVSPHLRQELIPTLRELKRRGETILLIEHDMPFVFDVADLVVVMAAGRVLKTGTPTEVQHDPEVLEAYLGEQL